MATKKSRTPAKRRSKSAPRARPRTASSHAVLAGISSDAVKKATGKTWSQWLTLLDKRGANKMAHRDIARLLSGSLRLSSWWSQMVTVGYEHARHGRVKHQRTSGYSVSRSKTFPIAVSKLYAAWKLPVQRDRWLGPGVVIRKATANKCLRMTWCDGVTHVETSFLAKGPSKTMVNVQHEKLADAAAAAKMRTWWGMKLERLGKWVVS